MLPRPGGDIRFVESRDMEVEEVRERHDATTFDHSW